MSMWSPARTLGTTLSHACVPTPLSSQLLETETVRRLSVISSSKSDKGTTLTADLVNSKPSFGIPQVKCASEDEGERHLFDEREDYGGPAGAYNPTV